MTIFYHAEQLPLFASTKVCKKCNREKPIDDFEKTPYGPRHKCKDCRKEEKQARDKAHPEEVAARRHADYVKKRDAGYRQVRVLSAEQRERNNQKIRDRRARDPEYRERANNYLSCWQAANRDKVNGYIQQWKAAHPLKGCEYTMSYNARKKGATIVDDIDYIAILDRDGLFCYICGQDIDINATGRASLAFDHRIPLKPRPDEPQGTHTPENLHPVHQCCNSRKHNKRFEDMTPFQRRGP